MTADHGARVKNSFQSALSVRRQRRQLHSTPHNFIDIIRVSHTIEHFIRFLEFGARLYIEFSLVALRSCCIRDWIMQANIRMETNGLIIILNRCGERAEQEKPTVIQYIYKYKA